MIRCRVFLAAAFAAGLAVSIGAVHAAEQPLRIHMISGSDEYKSDSTLKAFAAMLEKGYNAECTFTFAEDKGDDLPNLGALADADLLLVFCRRVEVPDDQLAQLKAWCAAGKPVVGVRTASHAFQTWLEFDKEILGGDYSGHSGEQQVKVLIPEEAKNHPILRGITEWTRKGKFYHNPNIAADTTLLLTGVSEKEKQPLAWCRVYNDEKKGRSFYTPMGMPEDFENKNFARLLINAIEWTTQRAMRNGE
jgi:type 1 glutamine amidotransferase